MRFIVISSFFPDQMEQMIEASVCRENEYQFMEEAVCMTLHPEGFPALQKAVFCARKFEEYRQLREKKMPRKGQLGILMQSLLGHGRSGEQVTNEEWQRAININGNCGVGMRMCMLDKGFRQYIRETVCILAKTHPDFLLVDDDVRLINNELPECFCPLHVEEFNRRYHACHTIDSLRQAVRNGTAESDDVRNFDDLRRNTMLDFARLIRSAIDSVDSSIPCGYCCPAFEFLIAGDMAKILAGNNTPFLRCNNALYAEGDAKIFPEKMAWTSHFSQHYREIPELLVEADTCPFSQYSKSVKGLHAQISAGILNGMNGAKIWPENVFAPDPSIARIYYTGLHANLQFYQELEKIMQNSKSCGVVSPARFSNKPFHPLHPLECRNQSSWQYQVFNLLGIPAKCEKDHFQGTVALAGYDAADFFSDAQLKRLCAGSLLLDGPAAVALAKRGLTGFTGCQPLVDNNLRFKAECDLATGKCMMLLHHPSMPRLEITSPNTEVVTSLISGEFYHTDKIYPVAPGCTFYENSLGGKVAVTALSLAKGSYIFNPLTPCRRRFWAKLLARLAGQKNLPLLIHSDLPVWCMHFQDAKKGLNYLAVCNLGADTIKPLCLQTDAPLHSVEVLQNNGCWKAVRCTSCDNLVEIDLQLSYYEFCAVRFQANETVHKAMLGQSLPTQPPL